MMRLPPTSTFFPYTPLFRSDFGPGPRDIELGDIAGAIAPLGERERLAVGGDGAAHERALGIEGAQRDRKSTRLNSSHVEISYAVFCLKKKNIILIITTTISG